MTKKRTGRIQRNRKKRKQKKILVITAAVLVIIGVVIGVVRHTKMTTMALEEAKQKQDEELDAERPDLDVELLTVNPYSRPGIELKQVKGIVIHYTANPGTDALQNRDYFEGLKDSHITKASSHFIVGLDGTIVQCIPTNEIAYASNGRNSDTISIECCHEGEDGKFNQKTYDSLVQITAWLAKKYGLKKDDIIRHYDVTGKNCPKYYVEHEDAWEQLKEDIETAIKND